MEGGTSASRTKDRDRERQRWSSMRPVGTFPVRPEGVSDHRFHPRFIVSFSTSYSQVSCMLCVCVFFSAGKLHAF